MTGATLPGQPGDDSRGPLQDLDVFVEPAVPRRSSGQLPPLGADQPENYGITIQNGWIEDLERTYGVKL
jgi:hypothetical protein